MAEHLASKFTFRMGKYGLYVCVLGFLIASIPNNGLAQIGFTQEGNASYYADRFHGKRTSSGERYDQNGFTAAHRELPFGCLLRVTNLENNLTVQVTVNDRGPFKSNRILDLSLAAAQQLDMIRNGIAKIRIEVIGVKPNQIVTPPKKAVPVIAEKPIKKTTGNTSSKVVVLKHTHIEKTETRSAFDKPIVQKKVTENVVTGKTKSVFKPGKQEPDETPDTRPTGIFPDNGSFKNKGTYNLWGTVVKYDSYCVQIGSFDNLDKAKLLANKVKTAGYARVYIQVLPIGKGITEYKVVLGVYDTKDHARMNLPALQKKGFSGFITRHI